MGAIEYASSEAAFTHLGNRAPTTTARQRDARTANPWTLRADYFSPRMMALAWRPLFAAGLALALAAPGTTAFDFVWPTPVYQCAVRAAGAARVEGERS